MAFWRHFDRFGALFRAQFWHFSSFGGRNVTIGWTCENEHGVKTRRSATSIEEVPNRTNNDQKLFFGHVVVETHLWIIIWGHLGAFWGQKWPIFEPQTPSKNDPKFVTKKKRKWGTPTVPSQPQRQAPRPVEALFCQLTVCWLTVYWQYVDICWQQYIDNVYWHTLTVCWHTYVDNSILTMYIDSILTVCWHTSVDNVYWQYVDRQYVDSMLTDSRRTLTFDV